MISYLSDANLARNKETIDTNSLLKKRKKRKTRAGVSVN